MSKEVPFAFDRWHSAADGHDIEVTRGVHTLVINAFLSWLLMFNLYFAFSIVLGILHEFELPHLTALTIAMK